MSWLVFALAAFPALLFAANTLRFRRPEATSRRPVSLLIPARNEEASIGAALEAALASEGAEFEVVVLDDHSEDRTAEIVSSFADPRVRLEQSTPLQSGWCGKMHACAELARHARHEVLVFVDADVQLAPDALAKFAALPESREAELVSGIPMQVTGSLLERLMIPLIHFVMLAFLPLGRMRATTKPAYAAGCGQLMIATRSGYEAAGGHGAVRATMHDGINLPRAFRRAGLRTDIVDVTKLVRCRMYTDAASTWHGLAKNAHEGLGSNGGILPWTALLLGGQVLPFVLLALDPTPLHLAAACLAWLPRFLAAWRFEQSWLGALLHPLGVFLLVLVQWYARGMRALGRPLAWKGRTYLTDQP